MKIVAGIVLYLVTLWYFWTIMRVGSRGPDSPVRWMKTAADLLLLIGLTAYLGIYTAEMIVYMPGWWAEFYSFWIAGGWRPA